MASPADALAHLLAQRVRRFRVERDLTVRDLATSSGLSPRLLALVEAGKANPTLASLAELAAALGVDVIDLLQPDSAQRSVALLGLRGAGKSTVGAALATRLGWGFVELDQRIESEAGLSLGALFELHGEIHLRRIESRLVRALLSAASAPAVLACGGGLVTDDGTWDTVRNRALTVWLKATPQEHWDRVRAQGDERPMAHRSSARAELDDLWRGRAPLYAQASLHVDTSSHTVAEAVEIIAAAALGL